MRNTSHGPDPTPGNADTGTAHWWRDPALAQLAFGSFTAHADTDATGFDGSHLALDLPEMLELDLADPAQRDFGDYELLALIGRGGMGVVYRAHQRSLDRDVALKLLSAGLWASHEFVASLRREAQHAALLQHPHIVTVYEIGEHHGLIYYAMELVGSYSLAERLADEGRLSPRRLACRSTRCGWCWAAARSSPRTGPATTASNRR